MTISKKILFIILVPLGMFLLGSIGSVVLFQHSHRATEYYIANYVDRQALLTKLYMELGYGKGIHAYKNYILRQDENYKNIASTALGKSKTLINQFMTLKPLSTQEITTLSTLSKTVDDYINKLSVASELMTQNKTITELDKLVRVDDQPAINALENLQNYYLLKRNEELNRLHQTQKKVIVMRLVITLLSIIIAGLAGLVILRQMMKSITQLMNITSKFSKGEYLIDNDSSAFSNDELNILGQEMIRTGKILDTTFNKLKTSNEDLEQFAFIASHDLQEPVKKIAIFADFLELEHGRELNPEAQLYLQKIKTSSSRMINLITALLDYSRLSNNKVIFENIDLKEIVNECKEILEIPIQESGIQIMTTDLPIILGCRDMIQRLFLNLISNAIKFKRSEGKPQLTIRAEKAKPQAWKISFKDNGIGFDISQAKNILKPFGRAHNKAQYPGTGIGLAACKKILENHHTRFQIESHINQGSVFSFELKGI